MEVVFLTDAWEHYTDWQLEDRKTLKKINQIIDEIKRSPFTGIDKPEPLKHDLQGYWSRRIDSQNRLVYRIHENQVRILSCKSHYL
jgi:toxin YoeB